MILINSHILQLFEDNLNLQTQQLTTKLEESDQIEFKQSLQTKSDTIDKQYIKPISGLANNKGGVIIFGISPNKELIGIKESQENLDNRYFSTTIRENIDGSIEYAFFTKAYLGKIIGFLIVQEARSKPVITKTDSSELKVGEIYFRYPAQTARISASNLRDIISNEIISKTQELIETLKIISTLGSENIAMINTQTGEIQSNGQSLKLYLNESILSKLNLIKQGQLVSENGAPAYIIKGEINVDANSYNEKQIPLNLNDNEILRTFLSRNCKYPEAYIQFILTSYTLYQPIHYFTTLLGKNSQEAIEYINSLKITSIKSNTRLKIVERLKIYTYKTTGVLHSDCNEVLDEGMTLERIIKKVIKNKSNIYKNDHMKICRSIIYNTLERGISISPDIYKSHTQRCVEAFGHLTKECVIQNADFYNTELLKIYLLPMDNSTISNFRKIICRIDDWLYRS
jgi:hypothetical protein